MPIALKVSAFIDRVLRLVAIVGGWCIVALIFAVCYDVVTRYFGVPKVFGLTSVIIQEGQYWLHSYAIVLVVGYAYVRQTHVRVDLLRERAKDRTKYWIEAIGCGFLLIPYSVLGAWMAYPYVHRSWAIDEASRSGNGIDEVWLLKAGILILFILIGLAGLSVFIKAVVGLTGKLPASQRSETING